MTILPKVFAQDNPIPLVTQSLGNIGGPGLGPFAKSYDAPSAVIAFTRVVSNIIGFMTMAAGIWFLFQFIIGGFYWITAGGDKGKLEQSRDRILNAVVGLLVVVSGYSILAIAGYFTGVDFTISNITGFVNIFNPNK